MLDKINSILRFDLCPLRPTNQGNDYYEPQFRQLSVVDENFDALFRINFTAPVFSSKVKYYKRLIDNVISEELNSLFEESADNIILFKRKKLSKCVDDYLFVIKDIIIKYNLDLDIIFSVRDFSKNQSQNECTYIFHYLILALIRCYMEFQQHFIKIIEPDKQLSIEDFFVQTLKWKKPDNVGIEEIERIEIEPKESTKKSKPKQNVRLPLSFTYKNLQSESNNINILFGELKKFGAIPQDFQITEFKHLFSGVEVANPIPWIGNKSDLAYLFKLLVNKEDVLKLPPQTTIWDIVDACFVDKNGEHFGKDKLRTQQVPKRTAKDIEYYASLLEV